MGGPYPVAGLGGANDGLPMLAPTLGGAGALITAPVPGYGLFTLWTGGYEGSVDMGGMVG